MAHPPSESGVPELKITDALEQADSLEPEHVPTHTPDEFSFFTEEIRAKLNRLRNPSLTVDEVDQIIEDLNREHGLKEPAYGSYNVLSIDLPCPPVDDPTVSIRIKVFMEMGNALSFSWDKTG